MQDWDDIPEPTEADLAEIDAAIAAAPAVSTTDNWSAWIKTYPVKQAVKRVGDPDGSADWGFRFAEALLEATEAGGRIRTDADRMAYLAAQWANALQDADWKRYHRNGPPIAPRDLPTHLLAEMLQILPLPAVARYLEVTERRVIEWMFPRIGADVLRAALALHRSGVPLKRAAEQAGTNHNALRIFLAMMREPSPVTITSNGKRLMPPAMRQRIADMAGEGVAPKDVLARIRAEMPEAAEGVKYTAVMVAISRARKAA